LEIIPDENRASRGSCFLRATGAAPPPFVKLPSNKMKLSILMPVYNERTVVERCISLVLTAPLPENMERELVIVDDCSTDGSFAILQRLAAAFPQIQL